RKNLTGVSHSVSRGVPSSNAARGPTASSHAPASPVVSVAVCFYLVAIVLQTGVRSRPGFTDVAILLDAYASLVLRLFLLVTHTICRTLINQIMKLIRLWRRSANSSRLHAPILQLVPLFSPLALQKITSSLPTRWQHNHRRRISTLRLEAPVLPRRTDFVSLAQLLVNLKDHTFEFVLHNLWNQRFAVR
ncbi:uncharacterized protein LOC131428766, partial [Malaya genurostris]|uniref:uncharacterized protein LOC131428766 n=1 Tax=Malaya genurostris TaxID=325434 RepID=UPI0026F3A1C5